MYFWEERKKTLSSSEKGELKKGIIEVSGKAMNRTALGVVDAMVTIFPDASAQELMDMLPASINPAAPVNFKHPFKPHTKEDYGVIRDDSGIKKIEEAGYDPGSLFFMEKAETFKSADGKKIYVSKLWESADTTTKEHDLENLINHVKQFGINVTEVKRSGVFEKGTYTVKELNPALVTKIKNPQKKSKFGILAALALLIVGAIIFFSGILNEKEEPEYTVYSDQAEIEKLRQDIQRGMDVSDRKINFETIQFEYNSDKITAASAPSLGLARQLLSDFPDLKVRITGHTSSEGKDSYNIDLSKKRAKAVVSNLTENGISADRLSFDGVGSQEPVAANDTEENRSLNRRIEFEIIDD